MVRMSSILFPPLYALANRIITIIAFVVVRLGINLRQNGFSEPAGSATRYLYALHPPEHPQHEELAERHYITGCESDHHVVLACVLSPRAVADQEMSVV